MTSQRMTQLTHDITQYDTVHSWHHTGFTHDTTQYDTTPGVVSYCECDVMSERCGVIHDTTPFTHDIHTGFTHDTTQYDTVHSWHHTGFTHDIIHASLFSAWLMFLMLFWPIKHEWCPFATSNFKTRPVQVRPVLARQAVHTVHVSNRCVICSIYKHYNYSNSAQRRLTFCWHVMFHKICA